MASTIAFVTFGMFIIDEIEYLNGQSRQDNLIGGAGVYAALGARLAAGREHARSVSWIVDIGSDFPQSIRGQIEQWDTACVFRVDKTRLTTRAWNGYGANEFRSFKYLTPKIRLEVSSLNVEQTLSSSFHMVCSPARCMELSRTLQERRDTVDPAQSRPTIIWEPIPDLCTPEELENLQNAAECVSVVSPNAEELAAFFGNESVRSQDDMVTEFMGWKRERALTTHAIIREGAHGSSLYIAPGLASNIGERGEKALLKIHLAAFHTSQDSSQVVDPTGGGNTYLGALAIGMTESLDDSSVTTMIRESIPNLRTIHDLTNDVQRVLIGAVYAVVAASYAIEQCGVPTLTSTETKVASEGENWNEDTFVDRMKTYLNREAGSISQQLSQVGFG